MGNTMNKGNPTQINKLGMEFKLVFDNHCNLLYSCFQSACLKFCLPFTRKGGLGNGLPGSLPSGLLAPIDPI